MNGTISLSTSMTTQKYLYDQDYLYNIISIPQNNLNRIVRFSKTVAKVVIYCGVEWNGNIIMILSLISSKSYFEFLCNYCY